LTLMVKSLRAMMGKLLNLNRPSKLWRRCGSIRTI